MNDYRKIYDGLVFLGKAIEGGAIILAISIIIHGC